jgi:hypothetical protein
MSTFWTNLSHLLLLAGIGYVSHKYPEAAPFVAPVLASGNGLLASPLNSQK